MRACVVVLLLCCALPALVKAWGAEPQNGQNAYRATDRANKKLRTEKHKVLSENEINHNGLVPGIAGSLPSSPPGIAPSNQSVLVTGGAGFVGMHAALALKKSGRRVFVLDNIDLHTSMELKRDRLALLEEHGIEFVALDVCDAVGLKEVIKSKGITFILHLAGVSDASGGGSMASYRDVVVNNIECFASLLEVLVSLKSPVWNSRETRLVFASSSAVYGDTDVNPFSELEPSGRPQSMYAMSKVANENTARVYYHKYGIRSVALRLSAAYGPWDRPGSLVYSLMYSVAQSIPIKRDFNVFDISGLTYIDDIASGIVACLDASSNEAFLTASQTTQPFVVNLGSDEIISFDALIRSIEASLGAVAIVKTGGSFPEGQPIPLPSIAIAKDVFGYAPRTRLTEGIAATKDWYFKHSGESYIESTSFKFRSGASRNTSLPNAPICFFTTNYAKDISRIDTMALPIESSTPDLYRHYLFTGLPNLTVPGYTTIYMPMPGYQRQVTKSRWPKFMSWKLPWVQEQCRVVFYYDAYFVPNASFPADVWSQLASEIETSPLGFMANKHPSQHTIPKEMFAIVYSRKDTRANIDKTKLWLVQQPKYNEDFFIYVNTHIGYNPRNQAYQQLSWEFWRVYSRELLTIRDQPIFNHFLSMQPQGLKPVPFPRAPYSSRNGSWFPSLGKRGFDNHMYMRSDV